MESDNLIKKLGVRPTDKAYLLHAPHEYAQLLQTPLQVELAELADYFDWAQAFYTNKASLLREVNTLTERLSKTGQLWISWPKKSSRVRSDLHEDIVREAGLQAGLVDVKVAAVDQTWSALKFVFRLRDR
jgi:hypothetical protein